MILFKRFDEAAITTIFAAVDPSVADMTGQHFADCKVLFNY